MTDQWTTTDRETTTDRDMVEDTWATDPTGSLESTPSVSEGDEAVEVTVAEIEQTRQELTGTVEAIGDRLAPSNIVNDAKQAVKDATVGKVENMASQASGFIGGATSSAQGAGGGVIDTIKSNPIPALMTGVGVAWLWKSFSSGSSSKSSWQNQASWDAGRSGSYGEYRPLSGSGSSGPGQMFDTVGDKVSGAGETVGNAASQVTDTVGNAASTVTGGVGSAANTVGGTARDVAGTARETAGSVTQIIGQNPLAAAAIAAAAGAAIGLIIPATEAEKRVMGDAGTKAIDTAKSTVTETMAKAESAPA